MKRFTLLVIVVGALALPAVAGASNPVPRTCTAEAFRPFSGHVWDIHRWERGQPRPTTTAAQRRRLTCAPPGHRHAMQHRWRTDKRAFYAEAHRCRSGTVVKGRVSYFGGGLMASGHFTSEPAIALNIAPGTESGWDNSTTRGWLAALQRFRVTIAGHTAILFAGDLGPAGFTQRAIDVTDGGVAALDLTGVFPTDAIGRAQVIPARC